MTTIDSSEYIVYFSFSFMICILL